MIHLGLGLYRSLLNDHNFRFARQCGATHIVVQLVDYVKGGDNPTLTQNYLGGWGATHTEGKLWQLDELLAIKKQMESHGLTWAAIENFDPAHWYDILLDGPKKHRQMEDLKFMLRNIGKAGIPVMGYYFSLAGVWGWTSGPEGRGRAMSVVFDESKIDPQMPVPNGMVWNMTYDEKAVAGFLPPVSRHEMWDRLRWFLFDLEPIEFNLTYLSLVLYDGDGFAYQIRQAANKYFKRHLNETKEKGIFPYIIAHIVENSPAEHNEEECITVSDGQWNDP